MTNSSNDVKADVQERMDEARDRSSAIQQDMKERADGLRERAGDQAADLRSRVDEQTQQWRQDPSGKARDVAIDAQAKAQWQTTRALQRAERTPDIAYLGAVFASMAASMMLFARKRRSMSLFVGLWPVTILMLAMLLKNRRVSEEVTRIPSALDVKDTLLAE